MNIFQELKEKKDILTKDGKVDVKPPYGRQKLTGQEVAQYFKKNKVRCKNQKSSRSCTRPRWCNVSCTKRNQKVFRK